MRSFDINSEIRGLPDDLIVGDYLTPREIKNQNTGWDEKDLSMDKVFQESPLGERVLIFTADTGLPDHVDIPKDRILDAFNHTRDTSVIDGNYHSTWIVGKQIASNNDIGYRGLCPNVYQVIMKVLNNQGRGSNMVSAMRKALDYWVNHPKKRSGEFICAFYGMSYGGGGYSAEEQRLFKDMVAEGIIPNASNGNESRNAPSHPAAYEGVLKCGAYDQNRNNASFNNYGPWTDFVAPGVDVPSTVGKNQYSKYSGTSMSRPITEACLANFVSNYPDDKWMHNYHGLKEAVVPHMKDLPGTWDGDGVFLPASATTRNEHFVF